MEIFLLFVTFEECVKIIYIFGDIIVYAFNLSVTTLITTVV